jgi:hypothetical protein
MRGRKTNWIFMHDNAENMKNKHYNNGPMEKLCKKNI